MSGGGGEAWVVEMKILSVNIRGLGTVEKRREIQRLVSDRRSLVLCIQETKLGVVDEFLCMSLWGSTPMAFSFKSSIGASGGILTLWDSSVLDVWLSVNINNFLLVKGSLKKMQCFVWPISMLLVIVGGVRSCGML